MPANRPSAPTERTKGVAVGKLNPSLPPATKLHASRFDAIRLPKAEHLPTWNCGIARAILAMTG